MRTPAEIDADAKEGSPFSNSTDWDIWSHNWCERCIHDRPARQDDYENACYLILVAMTNRTPIEFLPQPFPERWHCIEFRDEDDDEGPPEEPDPNPDQGLLFDPEPYRGTRMFKDVVNGIRKVDA
jgi:hypothetical protein